MHIVSGPKEPVSMTQALPSLYGPVRPAVQRRVLWNDGFLSHEIGRECKRGYISYTLPVVNYACAHRERQSTLDPLRAKPVFSLISADDERVMWEKHR